VRIMSVVRVIRVVNDSTSPDSTSPDSTSPDSTSPDSTSPNDPLITPIILVTLITLIILVTQMIVRPREGSQLCGLLQARHPRAR
jgi:hypothetical protein